MNTLIIAVSLLVATLAAATIVLIVRGRAKSVRRRTHPDGVPIHVSQPSRADNELATKRMIDDLGA